jgi:hypothetical protein
LFHILTNSRSLVRQRLQPPQYRVQERTLAFEDPRHESTERFGADENQRQKKRNLCHSSSSHVCLSESLRSEQGVNQVEEQPERRNSGNNVIHGSFSYNLSQAFVKTQQTSRNPQPMAT